MGKLQGGLDFLLLCIFDKNVRIQCEGGNIEKNI